MQNLIFPTLSLITSVKDYVEVVHKLIESDSNYEINTYNDLGALLSYFMLIGKQFFFGFLTFDWLNQIRSLPIIVPDIASAMISEISVLDSYFHNAFSLLEKPISYGDQNILFYSIEKFSIGLLNSLFLFLPTSTASLISFRRFVVQGIEAGYLSGLGTLLGSLVWIASILFGWRFLVIPWLSLDILRYSLGLILLVKYMWDSSTERRMVLENLSKWKIFSLTFLLAFTEQTSLFPFLGNISIGSDTTILETFPSNHLVSFFVIHGSYLLGLSLGGLSLLHFTCWFWENPAFRLYTWTLSTIKINARFNYKFLNFTFLYLTMICAMSNFVYFGLDYTLTKPLGLVTNDRLIDQKSLLESSFLSTKASDRNTRMNMGRRGRRERWKKSVQRYRNFDASLYGEGIYDLFTIEDLNYGFDRFWLRRKMRNHDVPYRLFPGPWVRSFKKQLSRPRLESFSGPRLEFFRILFEQVYHPIFHEKKPETDNSFKQNQKLLKSFPLFSPLLKSEPELSQKSIQAVSTFKVEDSVLAGAVLGVLAPLKQGQSSTTNLKQENVGEKSSLKTGLMHEFSALRKFVRKVTKRVKTSKIAFDLVDSQESPLLKSSMFSNLNKVFYQNKLMNNKRNSLSVSLYSKRWKEIFSKMNHNLNNDLTKTQKSLKQKLLLKKQYFKGKNYQEQFSKLGISDWIIHNESNWNFVKKADVQKLLSKKDMQILNYRSFLTQSDSLKKLNPLSDKTILKNTEQKTKLNSFSENGKNKSNSLNAHTLSTENLFSTLNSNLDSFQNIYKPLTLLHPIKFYLHKEKAFQRKFKFYGVNIFRNFGISNNSPYFRIMMKKFFYYYKPTLRWERTMRVATLKKSRRKGSRKPLRINLTNWNSLNFQSGITEANENFPISQSLATQNFLNSSVELQKPTHMYSLIGKRATRYRSQIYKDVLQHWYYSPFNRLLLKLDIDAFIRRQPVSHFLTKNEEHLLHFRRALLMDHFETLRWYTYMQHYRSMKTHVGGTKSFASRFYNQQFQGTFKKIRHLFSVTPSLASMSNSSKRSQNLRNQTQIDGGQTLLKWDQPLYNEYPSNQKISILNDSLLHEELLGEEGLSLSVELPGVSGDLSQAQTFQQKSSNAELNKLNTETPLVISGDQRLTMQNKNNTKQQQEIPNKNLKPSGNSTLNNSFSSPESKTFFHSTSNHLTSGDQNSNKLVLQSKAVSGQGEDLINRSKRLVGDYLVQAGPVREKVIENYLHEKNYWELTQFLFKGQKTRGIVATTQKSTLLNQEKEYLYTNLEKQELRKKERNELKELIQEEKIKQELWISLLKKSQTTIYDRKALKNYLKTKIDKQEKRKKIRQKQLKDRLNRIKNWLVQKPLIKNEMETEISNFPSNLITVDSLNETKSSYNYKTLSTGIQKAFKEAVQIQNGFMKSKRPLWSSNFPSIEKEKTDSVFKQPIKYLYTEKNKVWKKSVQTHKFCEKKLENSLLKISNLIEKRSSHPKQSLKKLKVLSNQALFWTKKATFGSLGKILGTKDSMVNPKKLSFIDIFHSWFTPRKNMTFQSWKRKQQVLTKRKQTRKVLKQLKKQTNRSNLAIISSNELLHSFSNYQISLPKKKNSFSLLAKESIGSNPVVKIKKFFDLDNKFNSMEPSRQKRDGTESWNILNFTQDFQTRRARRRGARPSRNRGAIKKPTLNDKLKRQFQILKRYGKKMETTVNEKEREQQIIKENPENPFKKRITKQRRTRQRENRVWHKYKKPKYSQNRRKMKKRKRFSIGKIRSLNKELKRVESYFKIRKWWWENFLPDLRSQTDTFLQLSKDQRIEEKLNTLSLKEINNRNAKMYSNFHEKIPGEKFLQIGNYDYKPLWLPCISSRCTDSETNENFKNLKAIEENYSTNKNNPTFNKSKTNHSFFDKSFIEPNNLEGDRIENSKYPNKFIVSVNPMPFYAGWDETLRKFVVTNRLLSRREAGYQISDSFLNSQKTENGQNQIEPLPSEFTHYPLKGMNVATTLYWQVPFTTYDPDQFFALGRDGFAPIGWKRFKFQYAKQTIKPIVVKTKILTHQNESLYRNAKNSNLPSLSGIDHQNIELHQDSALFNKLQLKLLNKISGSRNSAQKQKFESLINFSQKRNKRIKRHPRSPASFPSGPLINQVLPVHYIYVFYKRDRLPRDRYISRRLRRAKEGPSFAMQGSFIKLTDWTLRKRVKPRRKYHRKRKNSQINMGIGFRNMPKTILRRKFRSESLHSPGITDRQRPLSKPRVVTGLQLEGRLKERYKQRKKNQNLKSKNENLRIRQLRRRVQRQVFRPVWRYQPHPGGWLWPGDYFQLELIKAPNLKVFQAIESKTDVIKNQTQSQISSALSNVNQKKEIVRKAQKKKKRNIQNWQIQPKKYLVEKHNRKVLKKRLQKSQNNHKINNKLKELSALI